MASLDSEKDVLILDINILIMRYNYGKFTVTKIVKMDDNKKEVWQSVKGYEGIYEVSTYGRVKSLTRKIRSRYGCQRVVKGKVLYRKPRKNYIQVELCKKGVRTQYLIHRLVANAFLPNPENKPQVNHKDGDKSNNNLQNLEWVTQSENQKHAIRTGLAKAPCYTGEKSPVSKLKEIDVLMIRSLRDCSFSFEDIAERFNIHPTHASAIYHKKTWKHI